MSFIFIDEETEESCQVKIELMACDEFIIAIEFLKEKGCAWLFEEQIYQLKEELIDLDNAFFDN
jgi:hypothetical protein